MNAVKGVLAAAAVRLLAPYVANAVHKRPNTIKVDAPDGISIPPLRTYVYVEATGQVLTRTVAEATPASANSAPKPKDKVKGKRSAASKEKDVEVPEVEQVPEDSQEDDGDKSEPEDDGEEAEGDFADELQELAQLESKAKDKKRRSKDPKQVTPKKKMKAAPEAKP